MKKKKLLRIALIQTSKDHLHIHYFYAKLFFFILFLFLLFIFISIVQKEIVKDFF